MSNQKFFWRRVGFWFLLTQISIWVGVVIAHYSLVSSMGWTQLVEMAGLLSVIMIVANVVMASGDLDARRTKIARTTCPHTTTQVKCLQCGAILFKS